MCSVRQSPIPSAPNLMAVSQSLTVSAFVLIPRLLYSPAHSMNFSKVASIIPSLLGISPLYTFPVPPSSEIQSPSSITTSPITILLAASSNSIELHPLIQHLPIPLATTAAWEVIPPWIVRIPSARFIPSISSGDVSSLTRISPLPCFTSFAVNTTLPLAAPGDAGSPSVSGLSFFSSFGSKFL